MGIVTVQNFRKFADRAGVLTTSLCALHCLAVPVLLVAGTALPSSFFTDESFHATMLALSLPAGIIAFSIGCWHHKDRWVLIMGSLGLIGLASAAFLLHDLVGHAGEIAVTVLSAGLLIAAHTRNYRICKSEKCDQC